MRSLVAIHVVALATILGALAFSAALAGTLFSISKGTCPACLGATAKDSLVACATCGALHHETCQAKGCGLEHEGSHELKARPIVAATPERARAGNGLWTRVLLMRDAAGAPERRLLWRLEAVSDALDPEKGEVPGACFELPRAATGDALARSFQLAQLIGIALGVVALFTALLTPPGGALRLLRMGALALALAIGVFGVAMANQVGTKRLALEAASGPSPEERQAARADFGKTHGLANVLGIAELALVLVALALATVRRDEPVAPPKATA